MKSYKKAIEKLISGTGITINGTAPHDIQVHNPKFYKRILSQGTLGLGESYMEGWWDCKALDEFIFRLFSAGAEKKLIKNWKLRLQIVKARLFNSQTKPIARKSISHHYDLGNQLYKKMLDPLMQYSCGYWKNAENLNEAQEQKLKLICEKLRLQPGQHVLDIGCGWGGLAYYATKNYGVKVTGITISKEQFKAASERCKDLDVEIRFQDYREIDEKFDRIVSIGMLEHVGHKNYGTYMDIIQKNLLNDGICLLSFIGSNKTTFNDDPWIHRYIFPNGLNPSLSQIGKAMEKKLVLEDLQNIGLHYDRTLMAWQENFNAYWEELKKDYNEIFYRMWIFYLACSAAAFRARELNLWQMLLIKPTFEGEYQPLRI